jgi:hypothetical protein
MAPTSSAPPDSGYQLKPEVQRQLEERARTFLQQRELARKEREARQRAVSPDTTRTTPPAPGGSGSAPPDTVRVTPPPAPPDSSRTAAPSDTTKAAPADTTRSTAPPDTTRSGTR